MLPSIEDEAVRPCIDALFEEGLRHTAATVSTHPELFVRFSECALAAPDFHAPFYDSTFSRTVWRLYGGAKGLTALF